MNYGREKFLNIVPKFHTCSCFQIEPVHFGAQREEQVHVPAAADARKALPGQQGHRDHEDVLKVRIDSGDIGICQSYKTSSFS